ncbi:MAG: YihY family inner membrane protein [Methylococcaceae bacterium]|nr:YihY family inner membrane protein [Methylococcaceae bacterium]
MLKNTINFIKEDLWLASDHNLNKYQSIAIKCLRILLLAIQGFKHDLCILRASALTLYTVLSVVPVIAMLFGIAKGFGFEKKLKQQLLAQIPEQDSMILQLIGFAEKMLANTEGGVVAGIGIVVLFWTVIRVISNIEESFNHIWKIKQGRPLARKLSDYLSLMLLAPILLIASSSMTVFVTTQITWLVNQINLPPSGTLLVLNVLNYSPLVIMSGLFSFVFIFMPNQKINFSAGIIAGIITGTIYQMAQWAYLELQWTVSSYNAIYGSFTALPLFFIWLQLGWLIVLLGCEISFFIQHYEIYKHNEKFSAISFSLKKIIALQIMHLIIKRFTNGKTALNSSEIAMKLALPIAVVQASLNRLLNCKMLVELKTPENSEDLFQPAKDVNSLSIYAVVEALEKQGQNKLPNMKSFVQFSEISRLFDEKVKSMPENCLLKEL